MGYFFERMTKGQRLTTALETFYNRQFTVSTPQLLQSNYLVLPEVDKDKGIEISMIKPSLIYFSIYLTVIQNLSFMVSETSCLYSTSNNLPFSARSEF